MLFERQALDLMAAGADVGLATEVLPKLAQGRQLMIHRPTGFWQLMNTLKDALEPGNTRQLNLPWKI